MLNLVQNGRRELRRRNGQIISLNSIAGFPFCSIPHNKSPQVMSSTNGFKELPQPQQIMGKTYLIPTIKIARNDTPKSMQLALEQKFSFLPVSFAVTPVVLDMALVSSDGTPHAKPVQKSDLKAFLKILRKFGMIPVGILNASEDVKRLCGKYDLPFLMHTRQFPETEIFHQNLMEQYLHKTPTTEHEFDNISSSVSNEDTTTVQTYGKLEENNSPILRSHPPLVVEHSIRTGQQVYAKNRSLIILGSVNSGAEVLADGDIYVFGWLKGRALAGIDGNEIAKIFCKKFDAELVSIADVFTTGDLVHSENKDVRSDHPTHIWLDNGEIRLKSAVPKDMNIN